VVNVSFDGLLDSCLYIFGSGGARSLLSVLMFLSFHLGLAQTTCSGSVTMVAVAVLSLSGGSLSRAEGERHRRSRQSGGELLTHLFGSHVDRLLYVLFQVLDEGTLVHLCG